MTLTPKCFMTQLTLAWMNVHSVFVYLKLPWIFTKWKHLESCYLPLKSKLVILNKLPIFILLNNKICIFIVLSIKIFQKNLYICKIQSKVLDIIEIENIHNCHSQKLALHWIYVLIWIKVLHSYFEILHCTNSIVFQQSYFVLLWVRPIHFLFY